MSLLIILAAPVHGDELEILVSGIGGPEADNIRAFVGADWMLAASLENKRRRQRLVAEAKLNAEAALRPFGWYLSTVQTSIEPAPEGTWLLKVDVQPGPPLAINNVDVRVRGPGESRPEFIAWLQNWPLQKGSRLVQPAWDQLKDEVLDIAEEWGYLAARFEEQSIALNLQANTADLTLVLDTGVRAVMGEVSFEQNEVLDSVLKPQPRFIQGDPYRGWYVDRLRNDLWKTGYFNSVSVEESRRMDEVPPVVDFLVTAEPRKSTTHQATVGYGTDSELRAQYRWTWHRISELGDSLSIAGGYQQRDNEFLVSGEYRLPRRVEKNQFWLASGTFKSERSRIQITDGFNEEPIITGSGRVEDYSLRLGRGYLRDTTFSDERLLETVFMEYLSEQSDYDLSIPDRLLIQSPVLAGLNDSISTSSGTLTAGMDWSLPVISGSGFHISGHNERAWLLHSNTAWGSDQTFTQVYLSSRWNIILADRWKLLVRGEAGYTDAELQRFEIDTVEEPFDVAVTRLPYLYRFKAGGSRSVRGYDFESLSDNGLGANNIFTASLEGEYSFRPDWSVAAFIDIGNAFNSWSDTDLKTGVGVGLRWYTVAGPIRLDVASALDREGDPWSIHLTIGSPLL